MYSSLPDKRTPIINVLPGQLAKMNNRTPLINAKLRPDVLSPGLKVSEFHELLFFETQDLALFL